MEEDEKLDYRQHLINTIDNLISSGISVYDLDVVNKKAIKFNYRDKLDRIKEYANNEIESATEDIADYIDDDREGNKDIIGELKEWREHWEDIIRIMNNEKTYMDW